MDEEETVYEQSQHIPMFGGLPDDDYNPWDDFCASVMDGCDEDD